MAMQRESNNEVSLRAIFNEIGVYLFCKLIIIHPRLHIPASKLILPLSVTTIEIGMSRSPSLKFPPLIGDDDCGTFDATF